MAKDCCFESVLVQNNKLKAGNLVWIVIYKFFYEIF